MLTNICRVCLTMTKNVVHISTKIEAYGTVRKMLEFVSKTKVDLHDNHPRNICRVCLSLLKISYTFLDQINATQHKISEYCRNEPNQIDKAPVELVYGQNTFPLSSLIIVEEEEEKSNEQFSFRGFLNNLGTEISAKFTRKLQKKAIFPNNSQAKVTLEPIFYQSDNSVETLFECHRCKTLLKTQPALQSHLNQCNKKLNSRKSQHGGKRFKCNFCTKSFVTPAQLRGHRQVVHLKRRLYLCNVCGQTFNYSNALNCHMRRHSGEKNYVCNYCGLMFAVASTLQRHIRTHTKAKPYRCQYCCYKAFSSRGEQIKHERVHSGVKPYKCEYCAKAFTCSSNLNVHCLSHSGSFECGACKRTFLELKFLQMHVKRQHTEN